jgi:hypothetical protein
MTCNTNAATRNFTVEPPDKAPIPHAAEMVLPRLCFDLGQRGYPHIRTKNNSVVSLTANDLYRLSLAGALHSVDESVFLSDATR